MIEQIASYVFVGLLYAGLGQVFAAIYLAMLAMRFEWKLTYRQTFIGIFLLTLFAVLVVPIGFIWVVVDLAGYAAKSFIKQWRENKVVSTY